MIRHLLCIAVLLSGCDLLGSSGECQSGLTRPCSCPGQERNGIQTCGDDGTYDECACPELAPPPPPVEAVERTPEELARIALVSALASVKAACAQAEVENEEVDLSRWFHSSASAQMMASACRLDDQGLDVFRRPCSGVQPLCANAEQVSTEVEGTCWQFTAGEEIGDARVVGCETADGFRLVQHAGIESLRGPEPPPEDDFGFR